MKDLRGGRPIAIVEDNPKDSQLLAEALREVNPGQTIKVFESAEDCISFLDSELGSNSGQGGANRHIPCLFLLDLDLGLPGASGDSLIRTLRSRSQTDAVPIVVVTSNRELETVQKAYRSGANSYLIKPDNWRGLQDLAKQLSLYWIVHNFLE
ncbi:MAG: response regulator [Myxococcota bacterium]